MATIKIGDLVRTPRFSNVRIAKVLTQDDAREQGFNEPTHYWNDPDYDILGKATSYFPADSGLCGVSSMIFAAVKKS